MSKLYVVTVIEHPLRVLGELNRTVGCFTSQKRAFGAIETFDAEFLRSAPDGSQRGTRKLKVCEPRKGERWYVEANCLEYTVVRAESNVVLPLKLERTYLREFIDDDDTGPW